MPKLNKTMKNQIQSYLDRSLLGKDSFRLLVATDESTALYVKFLENEHFFFKVRSASGAWLTDEAPGRALMDAETYSHVNAENAISALHHWIQRVTDEAGGSDYQSTASAEQVRVLFDAYSSTLEEPEKPFSRAEAEMWEQRMDAFEEKLRQMEEDGRLQKGYIDQLHNDLKELQKRATVLPKKTLLNATKSKIAAYMDLAATKAIETTATTGLQALLVTNAVASAAGALTS